MNVVAQEAPVRGILTRSVDELVGALGMTGISKTQVSRLCKEIDVRVGKFLERPLKGDWPTPVERRDLRQSPPGQPHCLGGHHHRRGGHQ